MLRKRIFFLATACFLPIMLTISIEQVAAQSDNLPARHCGMVVIAETGVNVHDMAHHGNILMTLPAGTEGIVYERIDHSPSGLWYRIIEGYVHSGAVSLTTNCDNVILSVYPDSQTLRPLRRREFVLPVHDADSIVDADGKCIRNGILSPGNGDVSYEFEVRVCSRPGTGIPELIVVDPFGHPHQWELYPLGNSFWHRPGVTLGIAPLTDCNESFNLVISTGGRSATVTKRC